MIPLRLEISNFLLEFSNIFGSRRRNRQRLLIAHDKHALNRNPEQIMGKLQGMIDPKVMAQLGGAGNLMNMMKEMSNNPQME